MYLGTSTPAGQASTGDFDIVWLDNNKLLCYPPLSKDALDRLERLRSADAIVHEACTLFVVEKAAFQRLLAHNRLLACEVLSQLVRLLSKRLRETNDKMAFLSVCGRFE